MWIILRRLLLMTMLMFWQGGFMFYGTVVVPVGSEILGSHLEQGFITRSVTNYLNGAGAICLAVWAWDVASQPVTIPSKRRIQWITWKLLVVSLLLQVWLHWQLDEILDPQALVILNRPWYRRLHQCYLLTSTLQWIGALFLTGMTLWIWKVGDALKNPQHG